MSDTQAKETETEISTGPAEVKPSGFVIEADEVGIDSSTVMEAEAVIETETESDEPTELEVKAETDESIEIEIKEDVKPTSRRLSRFDKRIKSKTAEVEAALAETEALKEQLKLYQLRDKQAAIVEPDEDTFEGTDAELKAAQKAYQRQEFERLADERAQKIVENTVQQTTLQSQLRQKEELNKAHYARADSLKVKNYDQLEGNAVDIIGDDFAQVLIASTDNAHLILASMGANPGKAADIAQLAKSNPTKAFADALSFEIHKSLNPAPKTTLDPETQVDPGRGITSNSRGLEGVKFE